MHSWQHPLHVALSYHEIDSQATVLFRDLKHRALVKSYDVSYFCTYVVIWSGLVNLNKQYVRLDTPPLLSFCREARRETRRE